MTNSTTAVMAALTEAGIFLDERQSIDFITNDTVVIGANKKVKEKLDKVMEPFMSEYNETEFETNVYRYTHNSKELTVIQRARQFQISDEEAKRITEDSIEAYKQSLVVTEDM